MRERVFVVAIMLLASATAIDWTPVSNTIDNFANIADMTFLVANKSGIIWNYNKGSTTIDTYFNVASASKWITSLMVNKLVENGTMNYSDRPQKYIPWWTNSTSDPRSNVTLSLLLSFTSGFYDDSCNGNSTYTMETCAQEIYNTSFVFGPPGTKYAYGSDHLHIAGLMALYATGYTNWNSLFTTLIKTPFNLSSTAVYIPLANPQPAGGLSLKTSDYYKILYSIYMVTYVSNATKNIMEQDHLNGATIIYSPLILMNQEWHYGYGLWVECHYKNWQSNCTGLYSSPGKNGFYPWIDRQHGYFAIIGTFNPSYPYSTSTTLGQQLQPLILSALGLNGTMVDGSTSTTDGSGATASTTGGTTTGVTTAAATTTGASSSTSGSVTTEGNDNVTTGSAATIVNSLFVVIAIIFFVL